MKIIKREGIAEIITPTEIECEKCTAIFSFEVKDVIKGLHTDIIYCPCCESKLALNGRYIPKMFSRQWHYS